MYYYEIQEAITRACRKAVEQDIYHDLELEFIRGSFIGENKITLLYEVRWAAHHSPCDIGECINFLCEYVLDDKFLGVTPLHAKYLCDGQWVTTPIIDDELKLKDAE